MHISDGVLPLTVTIGGYVASAGLAAWSARRTSSEDLPKVAVVTAAFFVASLIHVPLGPTSVHLLIPGLTGALLGPWFDRFRRQCPDDGVARHGVRVVFPKI